MIDVYAHCVKNRNKSKSLRKIRIGCICTVYIRMILLRWVRKARVRVRAAMGSKEIDAKIKGKIKVLGIYCLILN